MKRVVTSTLLALAGAACPVHASVFDGVAGRGLLRIDVAAQSVTSIGTLQVGPRSLSVMADCDFDVSGNLIALRGLVPIVKEFTLSDVFGDGSDMRLVSTIIPVGHSCSSDDGLRSAYNANGDLAFRLKFSDGSEGIFRTAAPPTARAGRRLQLRRRLRYGPGHRELLPRAGGRELLMHRPDSITPVRIVNSRIGGQDQDR